MKFHAASMRRHYFGYALAVMLVAGCGDDIASEDSAAETDSADETAETSDSANPNEAGSEGVEGGDGDGDEGDGDGDEGDGDGDEGDGDGDEGDGDGDEGDGDGDGDEGDGDGDPGPDCVELLDQAACDEALACQSVLGQPLFEGLGAPCLEPAVFLGCIDEMPCDDAETWFCIGEDQTPHLVPNGCGPDGIEICEPNVLPSGDCP
jgi:hypothetical protein